MATALGADKRAAALGTAERAAALAAWPRRSITFSWSAAAWWARAWPWTPPPGACRSGLVEARDFASGTSSRSSKLIHGGLRYLEQLNFALVREALTERALLLQRIAPHLVQPVSFLYPLTHRGGWERAYVGAGVRLYDALGFSLGQVRGLPAHQQLTRRAALELAPALKRSAVHGAIRYWDAQVDDARFVITLLRTAASYGARVASRTQVTGFLREGERVTGVRARGPGDRGRAGDPRPAGGQRDRRVDRRHPGPGRRPRHDQRARLQGHSPGGAAGPHPLQHRDHRAHAGQRAVRDPVGPALDHRHDRHATGRWTRRTPPPAGRTSTTCSARSTGCSGSR